jgi:uncharacterized membrane protein YagU involved in acid resistance
MDQAAVLAGGAERQSDRHPRRRLYRRRDRHLTRIVSSLSRVAPGAHIAIGGERLCSAATLSKAGRRPALLGLFLHFAICTAIAAIFVSAARALSSLRQHLIAAGIVYGASVYFVMRWVVVPLSRFPGDLRTVHPLEIAVHAFGVGFVIALAARRFASL